ncbi:MAG: hypothetical protein ABEJ61_10175 [Haloferacaceae archaeon]
MCPPRRREVLRAAAPALALLGGCTSTDGPGTVTDADDTTAVPNGAATDTPTAPPTDGSRETVTRGTGESYDADGGPTVAVSRPAVRHGVVEFGTVHVDPLWEDGAQFAVADVTVEGSNAPDVADLDVAVEADTVDRTGRRYVHAERNAERRQRFAFPVPTDPAPSRAAVVWRPADGPAVRWPLSDALVGALGRAPSFRVRSFDAPDTAAQESTVEATVEVENDGERAGRFLAEVGNASISDQPEVTARVPVGETRRVTGGVDAHFVDGDRFDVVLRWAGGTERRTVRRRAA